MSKDDKSAFERRIYPEVEEWSKLLLTCRRGDYSASRIARAIEDCDCHLLNLNVTGDCNVDFDAPIIEVRVSASNVSSVARSLERYGYEILDMESSSSDIDGDVAHSRYEELMRYLQV